MRVTILDEGEKHCSIIFRVTYFFARNTNENSLSWPSICRHNSEYGAITAVKRTYTSHEIINQNRVSILEEGEKKYSLHFFA